MPDLNIHEFPLDPFSLIAEIRSRVPSSCMVFFTPQYNSGYIEVRTRIGGQRVRCTHRMPPHAVGRLRPEDRKEKVVDRVIEKIGNKIRDRSQ